MKPRNKLPAFLFVLSTATIIAGSSFADTLEKSTTMNQSDMSNAQSMSNSSSNEIIEILPEDFRPAFSRDTVIKLNAIVKRSYSVIGELDQFRKGLSISTGDSKIAAVSSMQLSENQLVTIKSLRTRSEAALRDMNAAVKELETSDEHYNSAVLAGMIIFVRDVQQEVGHFEKSTQSSES